MENQEFTISLTPNGKSATVVAYCSQYDVGRVLCAYIQDATTDFEIPSDATCTLIALKPDGNSYINAIDNLYTYAQITTDEQLTAVAGKVLCEIRITTDSYTISTINFYIQVEECPSDNSTDSESVLDLVQTVLAASVAEAASYASSAETSAAEAAESASEAASSAESASEAATTAAEDAASAAADTVYEQIDQAEYYATLAESWAVGGTDTRDDEDTNNSEYWSEYAREVTLETLGFSIDDEGYIVQEVIG